MHFFDRKAVPFMDGDGRVVSRAAAYPTGCALSWLVQPIPEQSFGPFFVANQLVVFGFLSLRLRAI